MQHHLQSSLAPQNSEPKPDQNSSSHYQFTGGESPGDLVKNVKNADSDSVGLEWGPRFCISNKLPGDADAAGPWAVF